MRLPILTPLLVGAFMALSACTSTQDVLQPSALVEPDSQLPSQTDFPLTQPATQQASGQQQQTAAIVSDARIQFAPAVGATTEASTPLSARLAVRAGSRGISLVQPGDSSATHIMKGYFSAISEGGQTTVIYVWDVLDPAGNRVHRIQGQSRAPAGGGDGWSSVQPATMEAIADQTVDQLASWLSARTG